jgi:hypothetical protein
MVSSCHERSPLSSPTLGRGWRPTPKLSFVNEFAVLAAVAKSSGSVATVTEGSTTAARFVGSKHADNNTAWQTAAISRVRKGVRTTAIASVSIGGATYELA